MPLLLISISALGLSKDGGKKSRRPSAETSAIVECRGPDSSLTGPALRLEHESPASEAITATDFTAPENSVTFSGVSVKVVPAPGYSAKEAKASVSTRLIKALEYSGRDFSLSVDMDKPLPGSGESFRGTLIDKGRTLNLSCTFPIGLEPAL
jgi:hypothetical protein